MGAYSSITPESFVRMSTRVMFSLAENIPTVLYERYWHQAQTSFLVAKTMGGFEGPEDSFLASWAKPRVTATQFVSPEVTRSVKRALSLGLLSQEMLDNLAEHGYQA